jgi:uncharacterized membrane protein YqjE
MPGKEYERGERTQVGVADLFSRCRRLAADFSHLAVLDARYAVRHIAEILCVAVVASVLVVTAWLAMVTAAMGWLIGGGTSWPAALLLAAVLNVVAAVVVAVWLRQRQKELPFASTLRQLRGDPPRSDQ